VLRPAIRPQTCRRSFARVRQQAESRVWR
jgi:hypothetical protein